MYDFIVKNLKHGHWVAVKKKDGEWKVFTYLRPDELELFYLEGTGRGGTVDESLDRGLVAASYSKNDIEKDFTEEYKIVTPAPVFLEPGTKVEILENCRELAEKEGWCSDKIDMIGKKGFEVECFSYGNYTIYFKDRSEYSCFPHWAVAPLYETENKIELTDEQLIAELEKRGRLKDKKVIE